LTYHLNGGPIGERNPKARLDADKVREIRRLVALGEKQDYVACVYGISQQAVSNIVLRTRWKHLEDA
jgi:DNA invertase Pin-like site-specific DNA recombinase